MPYARPTTEGLLKLRRIVNRSQLAYTDTGTFAIDGELRSYRWSDAEIAEANRWMKAGLTPAEAIGRVRTKRERWT